MRLTSKSQVTIPKAIRDRLALGPGDDIGFREEGQVIVVEKVKTPKAKNDGALLFENLLGKGEFLRGNSPHISSDDLSKLTRGPFDDLNFN